MEDTEKRRVWTRWWKACRRWRTQRDAQLATLHARMVSGALSTAMLQQALVEYRALKRATRL